MARAVAPRRFVVAAVAGLGLALMLIEIQAVEYAYASIGIGHRYLLAILLAAVLGSYVNVPLAVLHGPTGSVVIAVNLGGAALPVALAAYVASSIPLGSRAVIATTIVTVATFLAAKPVPGVGIAVPTLVPPLAAASAAMVLQADAAPAVAYVSGTLGTLLGADVLNLNRLRALGAPMASIGGAGTFDGIFVTGVLAALMA